MAKRIFTVLFVLVIAVTLCFVAFLGSIVLDQYEDTKTWQTSALSGDLNTVPPEMAKNYMGIGDNEVMLVWYQVDKMLQTIEEDGEIKNLDECVRIHKEAFGYQESRGITKGLVVDNNNRLGLYIDIVHAMNTAYTKPETELLEGVTLRLHTLMLTDDSEVNQIFLSQLDDIATDYKNLASFIDKQLPRLGTVEELTLQVSTDVDDKLTAQIIQNITDNELTKFPFISKLYDLLTKDTWTSVVLHRNDVTRKYQVWQAQKEIFEALSKSEYYMVSSITNYEQALEHDIIVNVTEREGYSIDPYSQIRTLSYDGEELQRNQYVRRGTRITATIEPIYLKNPDPEPLPTTGTDEESEQGSDPATSNTPNEPVTTKPKEPAPSTELWRDYVTSALGW